MLPLYIEPPRTRWNCLNMAVITSTLICFGQKFIRNTIFHLKIVIFIAVKMALSILHLGFFYVASQISLVTIEKGEKYKQLPEARKTFFNFSVRKTGFPSANLLLCVLTRYCCCGSFCHVLCVSSLLWFPFYVNVYNPEVSLHLNVG